MATRTNRSTRRPGRAPVRPGQLPRLAGLGAAGLMAVGGSVLGAAGTAGAAAKSHSSVAPLGRHHLGYSKNVPAWTFGTVAGAAGGILPKKTGATGGYQAAKGTGGRKPTGSVHVVTPTSAATTSAKTAGGTRSGTRATLPHIPLASGTTQISTATGTTGTGSTGSTSATAPTADPQLVSATADPAHNEITYTFHAPASLVRSSKPKSSTGSSTGSSGGAGQSRGGAVTSAHAHAVGAAGGGTGQAQAAAKAMASRFGYYRADGQAVAGTHIVAVRSDQVVVSFGPPGTTKRGPATLGGTGSSTAQGTTTTATGSASGPRAPSGANVADAVREYVAPGAVTDSAGHENLPGSTGGTTGAPSLTAASTTGTATGTAATVDFTFDQAVTGPAASRFVAYTAGGQAVTGSAAHVTSSDVVQVTFSGQKGGGSTGGRLVEAGVLQDAVHAKNASSSSATASGNTFGAAPLKNG